MKKKATTLSPQSPLIMTQNTVTEPKSFVSLTIPVWSNGITDVLSVAVLELHHKTACF